MNQTNLLNIDIWGPAFEVVIGADPENSERGGSLNKNFTFQEMEHTALTRKEIFCLRSKNYPVLLTNCYPLFLLQNEFRKNGFCCS